MEIKNSRILIVMLLNLFIVFLGAVIWQSFQKNVPAGGIVGQTVTIQLNGDSVVNDQRKRENKTENKLVKNIKIDNDQEKTKNEPIIKQKRKL
ncbi:hypothetical protein [Piscirickettsia litoralis]|uniref:Uncharacterized protein n=1 Tax=Piscirickettsia litoralis TaxID=1891921 RepID=A0ABX3A0A7_9GAMM|nr:hypothetical protein [Piscirickettsia litoralis]ODN42054.1 hypothetical protein BGC07_02645 [Piscirickettsia litoralis]